jgi:hypothetical protein
MFENAKRKGNDLNGVNDNEGEVPLKEETTALQALIPSSSTTDCTDNTVAIEPLEQRLRRTSTQSSDSKLVRATRSKPVCTIQ